ncbi:MAG: UDP-N-acetylglucosamine 1-carboxyvinyltransferase [Parcubacteria group bacterium Athens1014_10]|nr:MAG: UDP-N-acetylglucosamine 1-carboxyvinyltransferase [Parcubacteria group bacterium Athens1014_10]TSD04664.1 MAG: UDP-N-acetylglucosamine 1-carboxyvinyltransferase [Parcubacteria group bacterium Athens0714_12]
MSKLIIKGGNPLKGVVKIGGMKNAATPIIAATLLTGEECVIKNAPKILDVDKMISLIRSLGGQAKWIENNTLKICNKDLNFHTLDKKIIQSMRSSVLLLSPLLHRFKNIEIPEPGGCIIGKRPLDTHIYIFKEFGVEIARQNKVICLNSKKEIKGVDIILPEFSVTATENAIMLGVLAKGKTIVKLAALEPNVQDLCCFLKKMGAKIKGIGTYTLVIEGVKNLKGASHNLIPDQIEAGTFAVAAVVTKGNVKIENIIPSHLEIILLKLKQIGANFKLGSNNLEIYPSNNLKSFNLQTLPYPGFPTDLQAPFSFLATQCEGDSLIHETLYENRFNHIQELVKMGAKAKILDSHQVLISGPASLRGREIKSFDLRAGATLIIAGLIAQGETVINEAEIVDRGYERIEERLGDLGAEIKRVE